jgi:L-seryl-tRNA(Ser) seleniumtransferase
VAVDGSPEALARVLRQADPPVITRIVEGRLLLDPRTIDDEEVPLVIGALAG